MTGSGPVRSLEARDGPGTDDSAGERVCKATLCGNCGNALKKTQRKMNKKMLAPTAVGASLACSKAARCLCCRVYREVEREREREVERERARERERERENTM